MKPPYDVLYQCNETISDQAMATHPEPQTLINEVCAQLMAKTWYWFAVHEAVPIHKVTVKKIEQPHMWSTIYSVCVPVKYLPDPPSV